MIKLFLMKRALSSAYVIYSQSYNGSQYIITTSIQVSILYMTCMQAVTKIGVYDDLF